MKTRADFVTNSSSTSYCIIGVPTQKVGVTSYEEHDKVRDSVDIAYVCEMEYGAVGLEITKMTENETLKQFKERVLKLLQETFPKTPLEYKDVNIHVDGGYNG